MPLMIHSVNEIDSSEFAEAIVDDPAEVPVVHAIVLLKVQRNQINDVATALQKIAGVTEVYTVAGQYDLVAMIRAADDDAFAAIVTEGMLRVEGIAASETLISFKVYSEYDLESIFSRG